jgi:hypothetical protein
MRYITTFAATLAVVLALPAASSGSLFHEDFEVDPSASWTINHGPSDDATNFFFDYSTVGVPLAPNSAPSANPHGLKLQANLANGIFSGYSVSPTGQSFPGKIRVMFDWWSNFNGPFPGGGSGSTNLSTFGVNTAGTTAQWPGGTQDSVWFGATGDGGSASDYRAYSPGPGATSYPAGNAVYAAPAGAINNTAAYYAGFGGLAAPAAQLALYPQQTGSTAVGTAAMAWHEVVIENDGTNVTWTVDGLGIASVPLAGLTLGGGNIFFGHSDINGTSSTDVNDVNLLFTLIDNIRVVPEPGSVGLAMFWAIGTLMLRRRR